MEEDLQISVDDAALSCLTQIQANELAFAAVRADNSVITWGVCLEESFIEMSNQRMCGKFRPRRMLSPLFGI